MDTNFDQQEAPICEHMPVLDESRGESYCRSCFEVLQERIPEKVAPVSHFSADGRMVGAQHGPPNTVALGTTLYANRDARGNSLSADPAGRARLHRMRRVNTQSVGLKQRGHQEMARVVHEI